MIGTGWWATYAHLPALVSYPRAEVTAIVDSSPERLARAAEDAVHRLVGDEVGAVRTDHLFGEFSQHGLQPHRQVDADDLIQARCGAEE